MTTLSTSLLASCTGHGRDAATTVAAFLTAWQGNDAAALSSLVDHPPPDLAATLAGITAGLHASSVSRSSGPVTLHGSTGQTTVVSSYDLPGLGPWRISSTLGLVEHSGNWEVAWSPTAVAPQLGAGQKLKLVYDWPARADILGAGGAPLTVAQPQVVVGVEGLRISDPAALRAVLTSAGASPAEVDTALSAATAHPSFFEPVLVLSEAAYNALGGDQSALYRTPGTLFRPTSARAALTPGLAAHLVGATGPITAAELAQLGPPYDASDTVGQSGLEAVYEKQLAGRPGGRILVVDPSGRTSSTVAAIAPVAGRPVLTSIDPAVQQAAEAAMAAVPGTAALVAVSVSTGQVLASVSNPETAPFDAALSGTFPPGSTFKVLTSTALFGAGLSPGSPASCPDQIVAGGRPFHNAGGEHPVSDILGAFAESCNTAFIQLAEARLNASSFTAVASLYGLGQTVQMGYPAFAGQVPAPTDGADLAATAIGQGGVLLSPLNMATVAADVARGAVLPARLVSGAPDDRTAPAPLPAPTVSGLQTMMAAVVTSGTAAGTGLPSGTYAKTGTAEYGSGNPLPTDAWLMGWHGDVAFAMVEEDSHGDGGPVDGPVVARFLDVLAPTG